MKLVDIAVNLTDSMFQGVYRGKAVHEQDLVQILSRARRQFVDSMIITGVDHSSSLEALQMAQKYSLYSTAGIHPTHSTGLISDIDQITNLLRSHINEAMTTKRIVAIGECGLDYDRLQFASKENQIETFKHHFALSKEFKLPMFLHSRNCHADFMKILKENRGDFYGGVVHSFTGTLEEMKELVEFGLYIGVNGCSLKTSANVDVVRQIPIDKLLLETDAPWCGIRSTHDSFKYISTEFKTVKKEKFQMGDMIKDRNEPCTLIQVLEVISAVKEHEINSLAETIYHNTINCFRL